MALRPHARRIARLLLTATALVLAAVPLLPMPAVAAVFTDAAGRRVNLPERINRVLPAERNAEVLVYALAPDKLAGLERLPTARRNMPTGAARPPLLRFRSGATVSDVADAAHGYGADLILDAGPVTPGRTAFANEVQQLTGIPYVLVDDSFERMPSILQTIGTVLGVPQRADELRLFAENAIGGTRGGLLIRPAESRPRVYYGLGPDGLTTPLPGAPGAEAVAEAGAVNVAAPLGRNAYTRISREQLLAWNPDIIIAQYPRFLDALRRDRSWRRLAAVRNSKVYLEPEAPFGWIDDPPGVNRLIGLTWLSALFYPEPTHEELRGMTCEFYDRFYRVRLTNAQLNDMLEPAGIPRPEPLKPMGSPLTDLGAAPAGPRAGRAPPADFGTAPNATGTIPTLPPEFGGPPAAPGAAASSGPPPVIPGTTPGMTPGGPNTSALPALPDQPDALCTIPGVASPIAGLTGPAPVSGVPGAGEPGRRARQPGAGGAYDTTPVPGLPNQ